MTLTFLWLLWHKLGSGFRRREDSAGLRIYPRLTSDDAPSLADTHGRDLVEPLWSTQVLAAKAAPPPTRGDVQ